MQTLEKGDKPSEEIQAAILKVAKEIADTYKREEKKEEK